MQHLNVEFKARTTDLDAARTILAAENATGPDVDHQIDTYFRVPHGRLKLREGTVERALIHYDRPDTHGPKRSDVTLYPTGEDASALKAALTTALGVLAVVDKRREIYFVGNVKVHLDRVERLGAFIEVEAIADDTHQTEAVLRAQCEHLLDAFGVAGSDLVAVSYSDLLAA
jgi:predicted adenylyl cyclase CyaB